MALATDKAFKPTTKRFAEDESVFFDAFSKAFAKLLERACTLLILRTCTDLAAQSASRRRTGRGSRFCSRQRARWVHRPGGLSRRSRARWGCM
jgi:hypothetical protein